MGKYAHGYQLEHIYKIGVLFHNTSRHEAQKYDLIKKPIGLLPAFLSVVSAMIWNPCYFANIDNILITWFLQPWVCATAWEFYGLIASIGLTSKCLPPWLLEYAGSEMYGQFSVCFSFANQLYGNDLISWMPSIPGIFLQILEREWYLVSPSVCHDSCTCVDASLCSCKVHTKGDCITKQ